VGVLTATIKFKVSPEEPLLNLIEKYIQALRLSLNWIINHKETRLSKVHRALYRELREKYSFPARIAVDCYREAISIAKSWFKNPNRGRKPIIKAKRMWLTYRQSYTINLEKMVVKITSLGEIKLIGYPSNIEEYSDWSIREARLIVRNNGVFLHVSVKKNTNEPTPSLNAIAVDINEREIVYGFPSKIARDKTRVEDCIKIKKHINHLQEKYSFSKYKAWLRPKLLKRIKALYKRIRNITEDYAKKQAKKIIDYAIKNDKDTIILEDLNKLNNNSKRLKKPWRERLTYMTYRKLQFWIEWQAKKKGIAIIKINPKGTSTTCPYCGQKMRQIAHRKYMCSHCGFKEDRDVIAVFNLICKMEVALTHPTAPPMKHVTPNKGGELVRNNRRMRVNRGFHLPW